jgi:steroid delta-isomerase-like uncharacterized protein
VLARQLVGKGDPMAAEQQRAAIRRFIEEAWNSKNLSVVDEVFASDYVFHDPTNPADVRGPDGLKQLIGMYLSAFPDVHFTIEDMIIEGDKGATRWRSTGTHRGDLPNIPATGRQSTITGITVSRFAGDRIAEDWVNWDTLGMMQNLGVIPRPGQS